MSEELFFKIEAYLRNRLTPEDRAAFDADLAADPALAEQVAAQKAELKVMELLIEDDLRAEVKNWMAEREGNQAEEAPAPKIVPMQRRWWRLCAAVAAVLLLAWFLLDKPESNTDPTSPVPNIADNNPVKPGVPEQQTPPEKPVEKPSKNGTPSTENQYLALANAFREEPQLVGEDLRKGEPSQAKIETSLALVRQKSYQQAIDSLLTIQEKEPRFADARYNVGCIFYLQGKYKNALPYLETASENASYLYSPNARWYRALCLLATGKRQEAETQVDILAKDKDGDFYEKAMALKTRLKVLK